VIAYCSTMAAFAVSLVSQTLSGPAQPLPYSHKTHVALGLECTTCHVNPAPGKLMAFPPTALCMECHKSLATDRPSIQKLAEYAESAKPIPWVRVYKTPDYVFWKHNTHLKAGVTCAECHGAVAERDVIKQETNVVTMAGCLACHDKRQVFTDCRDCHEPRQ
jgi:c(7)-type cytochrome triheme protein